MTAFALHSLMAAGWLTGALFFTACQNQSEGERCDHLNGSADCESGLICQASDICCVPGRAACNAPPTGTGGASDSGPSESDAATESSSTSDAATNDSATGDSATNDSAKSEAATMSSETG